MHNLLDYQYSGQGSGCMWRRQGQSVALQPSQHDGAQPYSHQERGGASHQAHVAGAPGYLLFLLEALRILIIFIQISETL